jgi:hypothetical protein
MENKIVTKRFTSKRFNSDQCVTANLLGDAVLHHPDYTVADFAKLLCVPQSYLCNALNINTNGMTSVPRLSWLLDITRISGNFAALDYVESRLGRVAIQPTYNKDMPLEKILNVDTYYFIDEQSQAILQNTLDMIERGHFRR